MTEDQRQRLVRELQRDEGTGPAKGDRLFPYFDCCGKPFRTCRCAVQGKLTIGHGRNIEDIGISRREAVLLLEHDVAEVEQEQVRVFPWASELSPTRLRVFLNMLFNMGSTTLSGFTTMLPAMRRGDTTTVLNSMALSKWARQVKDRAVRLMKLWEQGDPA